MKRSRVFNVLFSAVLASLLISAAQQVRADRFDAIREKIARGLVRQQAPSLAVAVSENGRIVWEEGFGWADRENRKPATEHTMYSLASISKPITATGLMVLVQRGKIDLDKPANEYLGAAKIAAHVGDVGEATVRRLANHTSGLPLHYQFFYADEAYEKPAMDESIRRYGHLVNAPGETYQYANFGYGLLDYLIARTSEVSYAQFMRREVFLPLGMTHASVDIGPGFTEHCAVRYGADQEPLPFYDFDHPGASAVFCSAHDLVKFGMFHLKQRQDDQQAILSDEAIDQMQQPTADAGGGAGYGIGWAIDPDEYGVKTVSHSGGMPGVRTRLVLAPEQGIAVAVLANSSTELPHRIARDILAEMIPQFGEQLRASRQQNNSSNGDEAKENSLLPDDSLQGYYRGAVDTWLGPRPIEMWIFPSGDIHVQLGGQLKTLLSNPRLEGDFLTGVFAGDIATPDANRKPYRLQVKLKQRGDSLGGSITAVSQPHPRYPGAMSHWIELKKERDLRADIALFDGKSLDGWKVADENDFKNHGKVEVVDGQLVLGVGRPASGVAYAKDDFPTSNYEVTLEARRAEGSDFFCGITFPVGESHLSLIIGGWGGGVVGVSNLDGMSAVENETTAYLDVKDNQWYPVRLRVTPEKVEAWIGDEQYVDIELADRKLSIWWEQEPMRPFGIATWNTKGALRNIRLKRLK